MNNDKLLQKFEELNMDWFRIGLRNETKRWEYDYFCTPVGAKVFASLGVDGIHYCTIEGFEDTIFVVIPIPVNDDHVFPVAKNFTDFVRLVLALHGTNLFDQIPSSSKDKILEMLKNTIDEESIKSKKELSELKEIFNVEPMESPYEYVMEISSAFDRSQIKYSDEYYETAGIERE